MLINTFLIKLLKLFDGQNLTVCWSHLRKSAEREYYLPILSSFSTPCTCTKLAS